MIMLVTCWVTWHDVGNIRETRRFTNRHGTVTVMHLVNVVERCRARGDYTSRETKKTLWTVGSLKRS
jgi:hypothetical protein